MYSALMVDTGCRKREVEDKDGKNVRGYEGIFKFRGTF